MLLATARTLHVISLDSTVFQRIKTFVISTIFENIYKYDQPSALLEGAVLMTGRILRLLPSLSI
jgi:hypothetical protein